MFEVDIDKSGEGGIAELSALCHDATEEGIIVIVDNLTDDREVRALRLEDNQSATVLTTCSATDLRHHHEGMFVGAEIGVVEHRIGIEDTHDGDAIEVEALGNHLRADKDIGTTCGEVIDDTFVGLTGAGGVEVHAGDAGLGEEGAHLVLDLLRAVAPRLEFMATTGRTLRRHLVCIATVVA